MREVDDNGVADERKGDSQPDVLERLIVVENCLLTREDNDGNALDCKDDVSDVVDGQVLLAGEPLVHRHEERHQSAGTKEIKDDVVDGELVDVVAVLQGLVHDDVEDGHGDGSDELAIIKVLSPLIQIVLAETNNTRNKVEGVTETKNEGHDCVPDVLGSLGWLAKHVNTNSEDCDQV